MSEIKLERCGVVFASGEVLELPNTHVDPSNNFIIFEDDLLRPNVVATFHTHPHTSPNLSVTDYYAFLAYPDLKHYILSKGKIWCFHTVNGILCRYENPNLPRFPENLMS